MAQPGPFRWKMSASLQGQEKLLRDILERADDESQRIALEKMSKLIKTEQKRLVPRKTGELESEIQVFHDGNKAIGVGIAPDSPAAAKARATEYGTWNYDVGIPGAPKVQWPSKSKETAAMPWIRTSSIVAKPRILRWLRRYFITGKRRRTNDEP